jgi:hypothetical protein
LLMESAAHEPSVETSAQTSLKTDAYITAPLVS